MCPVTKNLMRAALIAAIVFVGAVAADAQGIGFRNELPGRPVIVQGKSTNGVVVRLGPPILIAPGKVGWDSKPPLGIRWITILDAAQPNIPLIKDVPINFEGRDIPLVIRLEGTKIVLKPYIPGAPGK
jgi:hypothetical protein